VPTDRPPPKVVVRNTTMRDAIVAGIIGALALGVLVYGVLHMGSPVQGNKLTGVVVEKQFVPLKEKQIEFSGKTIKGVRESDGDYALKVRVESEQGRIYEVPVAKSLYEAKKVGDPLTFVRPPSEQR
jgi:hypothetical protein